MRAVVLMIADEFIRTAEYSAVLLYYGIIGNPMIILVLIFGLAIGSFLNAYIWRTRHGGSAWRDAQRPQLPRSAWRGRSYCPRCKKALSWYELIPLFSFAIQLGRCRGCKQKIDWQYPLVEFTTAILFVFFWNLNFDYLNLFGIWKLGFGILIPWYLLSILIVLFVYDLRYGLVPDRVVLPAIVIALIYSSFSNSRELENGLLHTTFLQTS